MHDLIIIGGSAAATTAGIYAKRRGLNCLIVTKEFGGEVATSGDIGNWPGDGNTDGLTLSDKFKKHLELYQVPIQENTEIQSIVKQADGTFCVNGVKNGVGDRAGDKLAGEAASGQTCDFTARAVIVATGVHPRELNIPGEKEYRGKGVTYCTTCDGPLFGGKVTAVVGGGNSALEAALMMADIASKVYVLNKNGTFKGDDVLIKNLTAKVNVEILYEVGTKEVHGEQFVKSLTYTDKGGVDHELAVEGIFVHIGMVPNSNIVPADVVKNPFGEIAVNTRCETSIPGLFAAGDVTDVPFKQIVIAAGQGSLAALSAVQYLNRV